MGANHWFTRWISCVMLLACALGANAAAQVLPFEILTSRQGLPQSQVATVAQDAEGYIWVGTMEGLGRYNGTSFTTYSAGDGIGNGRIWELLPARNGALYAATGGGVSFWRNHQWKALPIEDLKGSRCRALAEDAAGNIWIGSDNGIYFGREKEFRKVQPADPTAQEFLYDLLPDQGAILAVTSTGLWRIDGQGRRSAVPGPPIRRDNFRCVAVTPEGLWLGSYAQGLWLQGLDGWKRIPPSEISAESFWRMELGPSGTFYIATNGGGLFLRRPGSAAFENWSEANGLPSNVVNCACEDRERNLWIGTDIGGLARLGGKAVSNHGEKQGLPSPCVFGITAGETADSLWLGTMRGAVHYQVRPRPRVLETLRAPEGLVNDQVWKIRKTTDGILWILSDTALQFRRPGGKRLENLPESVPLPRSVPYDIELDGQGRLWASGVDDDCALSVRSAMGQWAAVRIDESGKALAGVQRLCRRLRGGVWLSSGVKVRFCDGEALHLLPDPPLPPAASYSALFEDSRGRLWVGSENGLAVWTADGRWQSMNSHPGFGCRHVYFIGEDREGRIWVGTTRGVFIFLEQGPAQPFNADDGLANSETNQNGFFCDARGEIWIGTIDGMSQYNQTNLRPNVTPPRVLVEQARYSDRVVPFPPSIDVDWGDRNVTFDIAVLSFRNRARTYYQYWMEGLEDTWQPLQQNPQVRYTNLPSGRSVLHLKAVNDSGTWGEERAIPIMVHPPFYMTGWFQSLAVAGLLAAAVGGHRWRMSVLKRRNRELEEIVEKRTEELRKANQELTYLAVYEPLTGLLNRRSITKMLENELQPEGRPNRQMGCILVDLNKFKPVNDLLGHNTGDYVLKTMAKQLEDCLRESDRVGRYGGDEFLVVLPGADREAVETVCERISQLECPVSGEGKTLTVTASCGGVAVPGKCNPSQTVVLAAADGLMYKVKKSGGRGFEVTVYYPSPPEDMSRLERDAAIIPDLLNQRTAGPEEKG